jgi:hypothetical protein
MSRRTDDDDLVDVGRYRTNAVSPPWGAPLEHRSPWPSFFDRDRPVVV